MTRGVEDLMLAAIVICIALANCLDCSADAQQRSREPDAITLTRALVAEADGNAADYAPILAVMQYHADRVGSAPARIVRAYSRLYRARGMLPRIRVILAMPGVMPENRRAQWAASSAVVARWLAGDHSNACAATPHHFGDAEGDEARAIGAGSLRVDCGATRNLFWRLR